MEAVQSVTLKIILWAHGKRWNLSTNNKKIKKLRVNISHTVSGFLKYTSYKAGKQKLTSNGYGFKN